MANTFLTAQQIAREALVRLHSNMVMAGLVYTDYAKEFAKQGDTIQVKKPAVFVADDFGGTINLQDVGESNVLVKMDKIADVSVEVSSSELTMNVDNFGTQILDGATLAIAEKVDRELCGLYADIPYYAGVSGTTPSSLTDIASPMKVLNTNRVPNAQRNLVMDPEAQAKLIVLDAIAGADKSGTTAALREASMGRLMGFDTYMDQNIKTHIAGGYTSSTGAKATGTKGAYVVALAATSGTGCLNKGDLLVIKGSQYVVTSTTSAASANAIGAVSIYPALKENYSNENVTFPDASKGGHVASLAFHKNAFSLVSRPMELPMGGANAYVATAPNGLSLRVVMGYNMTTKKNVVSIDLLYGVKTLYNELACRMLG